MARLALLLLLAAAACRLDPAGRCDTRADCTAGLDCLAGVCAACRGDADCAGWEACGARGLCAPLAGRCGGDADCASWDACDAGHACVLRAGHCADDAACDPVALERCDPEHHCTLQDGRCFTDADCAAWTPSCDVPSKRCQQGASAGDDVLAWGTLAEGRCDRGAVARATTSAASSGVEVGFACGAGGDARAFVDPLTGALVYRLAGDVGGDTLRRFQRDAVDWDAAAGSWRYPVDPSADDELAIDAVACPTTWDRWVMQGGSGAILYGCPIAAGALWDFYDAAGARRLQGVKGAVAWNAAGCLLVEAGDGVLQVVGPAPCAGAPVSALPAGAHFAHRTTASAWVNPPGFRVALHDDGTGEDELWEIDELTGSAAIVGAYPDAAGGYAGQSWEVIDAAGTLYGRAYVGTKDVILRRPLSPGTVSEVYSEAAMPAGANDLSASTFLPFLRLDGSFLITTP